MIDKITENYDGGFYSTAEELNDNLKRKYRFTINGTEIEKLVDSKAKEAQKYAEVNGFRKGKVPISIVKKNWGDKLNQEVIQELVSKSSKDFMDVNSISTIDEPQLFPCDTPAESKDFAYTLECEIFPQMDMLVPEEVELECLITEVTNSDEDDYINKMMEQTKNFIDVSEEGYKAKSGDLVNIDFKGTINGDPFEGGTASSYDLELGTGATIDGFESQITGMSSGEEKSIKATFPEDYFATELANKTADFLIKVNYIKYNKKPKDVRELASCVKCKDEIEMRQRVQELLSNECSNMRDDLMRKSLLDYVDEKYDFQLPESMLKKERSFVVDAGKQSDKSLSDEEIDKIVNRRVKAGIVLAKLGESAGISITQEELRKAVIDNARNFGANAEYVLRMYEKNPELVKSIHSRTWEAKVMDFAINKIKKLEKNVSVGELRKIFNSLDT